MSLGIKIYQLYPPLSASLTPQSDSPAARERKLINPPSELNPTFIKPNGLGREPNGRTEKPHANDARVSSKCIKCMQCQLIRVEASNLVHRRARL
ncbi:hypothetical protein PAAG_04271 [Paracoccidioides lutzii Pb01]|uniref:Uncharacterized protein n=1 Tax=Paracoccidioides lutzii (strain ATCC MYA-826 / Pb01) TaxID=502779 RepID=C1H0H7_PARBA|nr:hypothetical protein PAAG_04271 [Paracoccidioides lutzii Pb01]EEH33218.2 hypothetical protein PAAG_04271 [Paracoccidioides lutzii Pb01]